MNNKKWEEIRIIDCHAHVNEKVLPLLISRMESLNIEKTIVVAGGTISPYKLSRNIVYGGAEKSTIDNQAVLECVKKFPGKLIPFYFVNPYISPLNNIEEIKLFSGIKLAPGVHGIGFLDKKIIDYVELASELQKPIYSHCLMNEENSVEKYIELAKLYPNNKFILGHAGRGNFDLCSIEIIESTENILFETSGGYDYVINEAVKKLGAHRVVFGSEFPIQNQKVELVKLIELLGFDDLKLVLRENILNLLNDCLVPEGEI